MKKTQSHPFVWFGIGIFFIFLIHLFVSSFDRTSEQLDKANKSYEQGEKASNLNERNEAFNEALTLYKAAEKEHSPTFGNGKLYYNLGNSYYQLEQYPLSYLNYLRAKNLAPRDQKLTKNIDFVEEKLGFKPLEKKSFWDSLFFFRDYLSIPEELELFFLFSSIAFLFGSLLIWFKIPIFKILSLLFAAAAALLFLNLFYAHFMAPSEALLLKANLLYRDGGFQYAKVLDNPLPAGTKVKVLDVTQAGKWIKIETDGGVIGYIPAEAMEII